MPNTATQSRQSGRSLRSSSAHFDTAGLNTRILDWYDASRRNLPWRYAPGELADPYAVWLSEIMLQQTTVKAVIPYFETFTSRWPTVADLASADQEDVLRLWAGLGYYARARNLHACAKAVVADHGGRFPTEEETLLTLPGVGPYTAAAIAAIAFDAQVTPVDGNIERVVSRLFAIETPLPDGKAEIKTKARSLAPAKRAGDFAQALMDLGATVCTPKSPSCLICPAAALCHAYQIGIAERLPVKAPKATRPEREGVAFVVIRSDGAVLLRKRPARGLLASMIEVPSTPWEPKAPSDTDIKAARPVSARRWQAVHVPVTHVFTHFRLTIRIEIAEVGNAATPRAIADCDPDSWRWVHRSKLDDEALPSVMKKVLAAAFNDRAG